MFAFHPLRPLAHPGMSAWMNQIEPVRPEPPQDNLAWLQTFYASLCDGDWEHGYGFSIENIDNPGWSFEFNLSDTWLANRSYAPQEIHRSERDWVICKVDGNHWTGWGGALNLGDIIGQFRSWVEAELERGDG